MCDAVAGQRLLTNGRPRARGAQRSETMIPLGEGTALLAPRTFHCVRRRWSYADREAKGELNFSTPRGCHGCLPARAEEEC